MKRILIYCVLLFALAGVAVAQVLPADKGLLPPHRVGGLASGVRTSVAEYDTMLTVRPTRYSDCYGMEKLVQPTYHTYPGERLRSMYKYPKHECIEDSLKAQEVYMARLEMLYDEGIRRKPLPEWVVAIVCNFEKLTGILNSGDDGDLFGRLYISSAALTGWKLWFEEHKEGLRFCPEFRVIYSVDPMVNMGLR
ncbi:MAG: hypothetical protein K5867_07280 [Bacteroidales bacterium]|nr:hypothetical protein [Bacteroidales bacterium]